MESTVIGRSNESILGELFIDWFAVLLEREYGVASRSAGRERYMFALSDGAECAAVLSETTGDIIVEAPSAIRHGVLSLGRSAYLRSQSRDMGDPVWWGTDFSSKAELTEASSLHMTRSLGQHKRYEGKWRLGRDALIYLKQQDAEHPPLFPNQTADIVFRSPGPGRGPFGVRSARFTATLIRAVLSFITASPFEGLSNPFPAQVDKLPEATDLLDRGGVPELNVGGLYVWQALQAMVVLGNRETFENAFGALLAFEQALIQKTEESSVIFFVTAIEALAVPNASWSDERITKRFRRIPAAHLPGNHRSSSVPSKF